MPDRRDIPDALRDAVERTVQATVGTRERAQGAASELSASVDELVKGAEKGLSRSGRSVRAAVEERLPATQEDVKAIRAELRRIGKRLDALEERSAATPATGRKGAASRSPTPRAKPKSKTRTAAKTKTAARGKPAARGRSSAKGATSASAAKPAGKGQSRSSARAGTRARPQR
jgi:hypothetical protein